jgi:hypothetical protein
MKKPICLLIAFALITFAAKAQEVSSKTREIGFNLSGSQFGVRYKTGNEKTLFRVTLLSLDGSSQWGDSQSSSSSNHQQGIGFNIGFEKRKPIGDNISFYLGSDLLTSFDSYQSKIESTGDRYKNSTLSAGLGFVMGVNFKLTDRINISTEVVPSVVYSKRKSESETQFGDTESTSNLLNYGLSTQGINLTMSFSLTGKNKE